MPSRLAHQGGCPNWSDDRGNALSGGLLGVGLAFALIRTLKLIGGYAIPRLDAVRLGWPTLTFCAVAAVAAAVLAGLAPAWHAARANAADGLKGTRTGSAGRTERRFLGSAAIIQTALTLALLVGAGLLVRTGANLAHLRPGYDTEHVRALSVTMPDPTKSDNFHRQALLRVAALPGVKRCGLWLGCAADVGFSVVGLVLALVGIYGVLSLSVNSRQREIAIRIAIGAPRNNVLGLVLSEGLRLMLVGVVVGTVVAFALARVLKSYLYGVAPTDPFTFMAVALPFVVVTLFACYFPAPRATRVDPMVALRQE